jgi:hypothetical protein
MYKREIICLKSGSSHFHRLHVYMLQTAREKLRDSLYYFTFRDAVEFGHEVNVFLSRFA